MSFSSSSRVEIPTWVRQIVPARSMKSVVGTPQIGP